MSTLAELRQQVRDYTSIKSTSVLPDAEVDRFINSAHSFLLTTADWPMLRETVSWLHTGGSPTHDLSAQVPVAYRVIDVFAQESAGGNPRQLNFRDTPLMSQSRTGAPREFSWDQFASNITLFPTPSKDVLMTGVFVVEPAELVNDSDTTQFPARFAQAVSLLASARILEREGDGSDRGQSYELRAFQTVEQAKRMLLTPASRTVSLGSRKTRGRGVRR